MREADIAALQPQLAVSSSFGGEVPAGTGGFSVGTILAWAAVGIPILWGV